MEKSLLGCCAILCCMINVDLMAGNSYGTVYSNINMRNAEGDSIVIDRGISSQSYFYDHRETVNSGDYVRKRAISRTGMYDDLPRNYVQQETEKNYGTAYKRDVAHKTTKRKYFIANPFYQPLRNQIGSVTTGEYMEGKYKFADVNRTLGEFSIKEDLSYGLTDRIALQGMIKYNSDKLTWKNSVGDKDEYKNNDLNVFGLGVQGRIIDTSSWISTLAGYYEHQKHGIDYYIADFKAGYKIDTSTIYGLGRMWLVDMDGDIYGDYMEDVTSWGMLIYGDANDSLFMGEIGIGTWTVLAEDWTFNIEGLYGLYDWHNQMSIKGAFGWQPNDFFALNLYAKTSIYDSANNKNLDLVAGSLPLTQASWQTAWNTPLDSTGNGHALVELSKSHEWSVGLQMMFQF